MALWLHDATGKQFDDGLTTKPGEEGFTREFAEKHFGTSKFSYSGTPNWAPPVVVAKEEETVEGSDHARG